MHTPTDPHATQHLRRLLTERVAQVSIGAGEYELADAIGTVLDLIEQADQRGRGHVSTGALRLAVRKGLMS